MPPEEAAVEEWMLKEEEDLGRLLTNGARRGMREALRCARTACKIDLGLVSKVLPFRTTVPETFAEGSLARKHFVSRTLGVFLLKLLWYHSPFSWRIEGAITEC